MILDGLLGLAPAARADIDCSPLAPNAGLDRDVEGKLAGKANLLLRKIGSAELDGEYKNVQKDVLHEYPNADTLLMWRSFLYVTCTFVANAREWSDDQKYQKFEAIMDRWQRPAPARPSSPTSNQAPGAAPSSAFDGRGWKFDIFYCTSADGDDGSSEDVASRLADVLRPQSGVSRVQVKPWPRVGTTATNSLGTFVYAASQSPIEIKVTPQRESMARGLKDLWAPVAVDSGPIGTAAVGSNYQNYISTVVCENH